MVIKKAFMYTSGDNFVTNMLLTTTSRHTYIHISNNQWIIKLVYQLADWKKGSNWISDIWNVDVSIKTKSSIVMINIEISGNSKQGSFWELQEKINGIYLIVFEQLWSLFLVCWSYKVTINVKWNWLKVNGFYELKTFQLPRATSKRQKVLLVVIQKSNYSTTDDKRVWRMEK